MKNLVKFSDFGGIFSQIGNFSLYISTRLTCLLSIRATLKHKVSLVPNLTVSFMRGFNYYL